MDILTEIQQAIAKFDPELAKNEEGEEDKVVSSDDYQDAIDSNVDPEDLNFSMDPLEDDEELEDEEIEHFEIPQKDFDEQNLEVGDAVRKIVHKNRIGEILAIGELVEVQWQEDLITLEYPEELIKVDNNENPEESEVKSLETIPPIPLEKNS